MVFYKYINADLTHLNLIPWYKMQCSIMVILKKVRCARSFQNEVGNVKRWYSAENRENEVLIVWISSESNCVNVDCKRQ